MKITRKLYLILLMLFAVVFVCPYASQDVYAEDEKNYVVESSDVNERLYANLCDVKKEKDGVNSVTTLYQKDFIDLVELDLTIDYKISYLDGLDNFYFDSLKVVMN